MNLNALPSSFASEQIHEDHDQPYPQLFGPNYRVTSSSSSGSCHIFLNSAQDHTGYYHHQLYQHDRKEDDTYAYSGGSSSYELKNKAHETSGLKLTLWKKEPDHDQHDHGPDMVTHEIMNHNNPVKCMSSKMRLMQKMKTNPEPRALKITSGNKTKIGDHKLQPSSSFESSTKISSCNNNSPIRVCGDCNTTKTPLWRSGPKGPKSLCNACGIRQRKARRALAAAGNGTGVALDQTTTALKIKMQNKEKNFICKNVPLKKRYKLDAAASSTSGGSQSNNGQKIEDFLINFSKNLVFHRMFPEDEKDAAILLMALSSGLVHG